MKRLLLAWIVVVAVSGMAVAQDFPRFEIYGGYSAQRLGISDDDLDSITSIMEEEFELICPGCDSSVTSSKFLKKGFEGAFTVNVNSYFGIAVDVRYGFDDIITGRVSNGSDLDINANIEYKDLAILAGPRFAFRTERVTPFVHALFGMDRGKVKSVLAGTETDSWENEETGLGIAVGGGFDVNLGNTVALRLAQVDYYLTRYNEEIMNNISFSGGIVFRFGWVD